jgi:DNA-binding transcriptional ArsR family regulator
MADPVVVLEPGGEQAQKIAKAMASQTAGDILRLIGEGQKTSTEIADALSLPMNTAKYHIDNLLDAGLISVAATKYSVKGREVKVYTLTNQLLIVAPKQLNVRSLLMKYASLFGIVAFGSVVIALLSPLLGSVGSTGTGISDAGRFAAEGAGRAYTKAAADAVVQNVTGAPQVMAAGSNGVAEMAGANLSPPPDVLASMTPVSPAPPAQIAGVLPDPALMFLLGGTLVILLLAAYELSLWRRAKYP